MDEFDRIQCRWCGAQSADPKQCPTCGAPLNTADLVSESGWREAPRLRDMSEFRFGNCSCQVEGDIVPVVETTLAAGEGVYFEHHAMLWKQDTVPMSLYPITGPKRSLLGLPHLVTLARGPGRIAFSRDATGEIIVLPMAAGIELDVREHAFLLASESIAYSYVRVKGLANILHGGNGMWMDRFTAKKSPGLLVLHGFGNVFVRTLASGESIQLEPGSMLFKDATVQMAAEKIKLSTGFLGGTSMNLARMTGPGRIGIQSMYHHHASDE